MDERYLAKIKHPITTHSVVGILAFGAGMGVMHIWRGRRLKEEARDVVEQLVINFHQKERYSEEIESVELPTPTTYGNTSAVVVSEGEVPDEPECIIEFEIPEEAGEPADMPVPTSIFAGGTPEWDMELEASQRSSQEPYVLHKDEFYSEESGYSQTTCTWYAGDDIMVDQEDVPIYNHDSVVGPLMFGHGSDDPNVFYVRNDKLKAEYEVLRSTGYYSVDVLGLEIEEEELAKDLKHSRVMKFRLE